MNSSNPRMYMKKPLLIPMPEMNQGRPCIDRTPLIVELDIDRAIAGVAFATSEAIVYHADCKGSFRETVHAWHSSSRDLLLSAAE
jgi:hypothetical protein